MSVSLYRLEMDKRKGVLQSILEDVRREMGTLVGVPQWSHDTVTDGWTPIVPVPLTETPIRFGRVGSHSFTFRGV